MADGGWRQPIGRDAWTDVCSFVSRLDQNYFHWIVDSCGQVEGMEAYEQETGIRPRVLIRSGGPGYLRASLELLGVEPERIIQWSPDAGPRPVERLVVVSRPGNQVACSPASLRWLRRRFLGRAEVERRGVLAERLLYVPRRQGGWRYVVNEAEVLRCLATEGVEVVRPEGMPLAAQIRLFATARCIVGLHGAGLTNLLFSPGASIVELRGSYGGNEYHSMATALGHRYTALACESMGSDDRVRVDPDALLRMIHLTGGPRRGGAEEEGQRGD